MKKLSERARIALVLTAVIVAIIVFRQQSNWVEAAYYKGFYPAVCHVVRPLVNVLPFSLGDLGYLCLIMGILAGTLRLIRYLVTKRYARFKQAIWATIIAAQALWLMFTLFWGLNYYRPSAAEVLKLNDTTYNIKDVAKVTSLIIDSANACRARLSAADTSISEADIYREAQTAVQNIASQSAQFRVISPAVKPSLFSPLLNYMGTAGYYNPFSFEAQLNNMMPLFDKPFTACHEISHQAGWAREDEANFMGYVASVQSKNHSMRYSAYYTAIGEFMRYLRRRDTVAHKLLRKKISPLVMQDFKTDSAYWTKYAGNAQIVSGVFYDNFLKANNQPRGLHTYNRMIILTMAWYRKQYQVW